MDDDFDTPNAVGGAFQLLREARAASGPGAAALAAAVFDIFERALGLPLHDRAEDIPAEIQASAAERDQARAAKDFKAADAIRARLQAAGYIVEDGPDGTVIRKS
jgi:cysteinyl-tRNA synthetase